MDTQVMLSLIFIDVQYSQKTVFSFETDSDGQNHSSSGSHHLAIYFPRENFYLGAGGFPPPITAIWKTLLCASCGNCLAHV